MEIKKALKKRLKAKNPFILILALISLVGFTFSSILFFFEKDLSAWQLPIIQTLLGIGFIFESEIRKTIAQLSTKKAKLGKIFGHIITFILGIIILIGGILLLLNVPIALGLASFLGFANVMAVLVIILEVFVI